MIGRASSKRQCTNAEIEATLTPDLQDVGNSLIDDSISINDLLRMILEAMYTGMGFGHRVLWIKDGRCKTMCGKFGFGDDVQRQAVLAIWQSL